MFPLRDSVSCRTPPTVVITIIVANAVIFFYEQTLSLAERSYVLAEYALIPARHFDAAWARAMGLDPADLKSLVTSMFLHGGWLHVILNMWTLWIFGCAMEDKLGHGRFLVFYVLCGVAAVIAHVTLNPVSLIPVVGASGAVAGVIAAYAVTYPKARLTVMVPLFFVIPLFMQIPAVFFALFWFLMQILQGSFEFFAASMGSGGAWWAHLGGFVSGLLLLWLMAPAEAERLPSGER